MITILVVDDDKNTRLFMKSLLENESYNVVLANDGQDALECLDQKAIDLMIVDIMMPNESGLVFLKKLREESDVPVILLTAMGETRDRIAGLETGADDYLPKPFEPKELVLRIKSILKRTPKTTNQVLEQLNLGLCVFNLSTKELFSKQGHIIHITPVEQSLLSVLGQKYGQVFSREKLADLLGAGQSPRSIDVQITRLRKKIEKDSKNPRYLQTVRGKGYMLLPE